MVIETTPLRSRLTRRPVYLPLLAGATSLITSLTTLFAGQPVVAEVLAAVGAVLTALGAALAATVPPVKPVVSVTPRVWALPQRLDYFTGRSTDLGRISDALGRGRHPDVVIVWGLGAVGKTSLVLEYAHRVTDAMSLTVWISASSRQGVLAALAELGREVGVADADDDLERAARATLASLPAREPWLLVYDGATPATVRDLIPTTGVGDVIITSRGNDWDGVGTTVELDTLPEDAAVDLLLARSQDRSPDAAEQAKDLARRLGYLPHALDLAGAYCRNTCMLGEYRDLFEQVGIGLLRENSAHGPAEITTSLSEQRLARGSDRQLLRMLAFLAPGYVPQSLFTAHVSQLPRQLRTAASYAPAWHALVNRLHAAGLIRAEPGMLWVHQLTQEAQQDFIGRNTRDRARRAIRWMHAATGRDATAAWPRERWLSHAADLLFDVFRTGDDPACWRSCSDLTRHADRVLAQLDGEPSAESGDLRMALGTYCYARGEFAVAKDLFSKALDVRQQLYGPDDPETLRSMSNLALVFHDKGDLVAARELNERSLAGFRRRFGDRHVDTLKVMNNLGLLLLEQGELDQARAIDEAALAARTTLLGPEHPDTLRSMNNLGLVLYRQGEFDAACDLHRHVLDVRRRTLRADHPETLQSMHNLGRALIDRGDLDDGRLLLEDARAARQRTLGAEHPDTISSANALATAAESSMSDAD